MTVFDVSIGDREDLSIAEELIETLCVQNELRVTLKGSLSKYPGSVHWHLKRGSERGTLEITFWKRERRIWLSIQAGRTGTWIEKSAVQLKKALEAKLTKSAP